MKNKKTGKLLLLALTFAMTAILTACGSDSKSAGSELFKTMDTVDLKGNKADSSLFAGNTLTMVNLWNVGCTPCIEEIPTLDKLNKEYEGKGFAVKGLYYSAASILSEEERGEIEAILENAEAEYPQLILSENMINDKVIQNIQAFPTTFFVNSEGKIVRQIMGARDYDGWKEIIEKELVKAEENAEK